MSEKCNICGFANGPHDWYCPKRNKEVSKVVSKTTKSLREEVRSLRSQLEEKERQLANVLESHRELDYKCRQYRELVNAVNEAQDPDGGIWAWLPDEDNHLESLSCPVVIPAEWLRNLLSEKDKALEEARGVVARCRRELYCLIKQINSGAITRGSCCSPEGPVCEAYRQSYAFLEGKNPEPEIICGACGWTGLDIETKWTESGLRCLVCGKRKLDRPDVAQYHSESCPTREGEGR